MAADRNEDAGSESGARRGLRALGDRSDSSDSSLPRRTDARSDDLFATGVRAANTRLHLSLANVSDIAQIRDRHAVRSGRRNRARADSRARARAQRGVRRHGLQPDVGSHERDRRDQDRRQRPERQPAREPSGDRSDDGTGIRGVVQRRPPEELRRRNLSVAPRRRLRRADLDHLFRHGRAVHLVHAYPNRTVRLRHPAHCRRQHVPHRRSSVQGNRNAVLVLYAARCRKTPRSATCIGRSAARARSRPARPPRARQPAAARGAIDLGFSSRAGSPASAA